MIPTTTMTLTRAPEDIGTGTYQAWDKLFEVFGNHGFHPIEARGVLMAAFGISRTEARATVEHLVNQGYASSHETYPS